jgi:hypothetical protein
MQLAVVSDIHYAGPSECRRVGYPMAHINSRWQRLSVAVYRRYIWQRDPFAHNHLLDEFIKRCRDADYVVANGDYSCDSAAIGVADDAACESARQCLGKLRSAFGGRFEAIFGDHELGKRALGGDKGGLRLASFIRCGKELELKPFWQREFGNYRLIGMTSTLAAYPVYRSETLPHERPDWEQLGAQHLDQIRKAFASLRSNERVLLFCHDPTALPFLARDGIIGPKVGQIERTIIGHLHSGLILFKSRLLAGMPIIRFMGHTTKRLSSALNEARYWKPFKVLLCPSLSGIELLRDGGFYRATIDPEGRAPAKFQLHRLNGRKNQKNSRQKNPAYGSQ